MVDTKYCICTKEFKRGIGSLFDPCVNAYGATAILPVTYGGELLYLRIWRDHLGRSAHMIVTADSQRDKQYACVIVSIRERPLTQGLFYNQGTFLLKTSM